MDEKRLNGHAEDVIHLTPDQAARIERAMANVERGNVRPMREVVEEIQAGLGECEGQRPRA